MISAIAALAVAGIGQGQIQDWVGKARYYSAKDGQAVFEVSENGVTLDFKGGTIQPANPINPDQSSYTGIGLLIRAKKDVTIKNLTVRGYRFNIVVQDCENVRIQNCSLGGSRCLPTLRDARPVNTFLDIRNVEVWRTYGAAIWVENSADVQIQNNRANGSQNGVVLVDAKRSTIYDNDFSFNSGWGIALARSVDNDVIWNRVDFVNRPWAGGWGGDSSAIAVADSSHRNYFVGNSLTHSGDGFFLTHRSDTFDEKNGKIELIGASNDNVIAHNDGSWSTANAFEGTFSQRNVYYKNWANHSLAAGFWLGYSDESLVLENEVKRSRNSGIAIEHGSRNLVQSNVVEGSAWAGVAFWAAEDWRSRAKPSRDNDSVRNKLTQNNQPYDLKNSIAPFLSDELNPAGPGNVQSTAKPNTSGYVARLESEQLPKIRQLLNKRPKGWKFYRETTLAKGHDWIQPVDWATRDFRSDLAAWRQPDPGSIEMLLNEDGVRVAAPFGTQFEPTPENPRLVRLTAVPESGAPGAEMPVVVTLGAQDTKRKQQIRTTLRTVVWDVAWHEWPGMQYDDAEAWSRLFAGPPKWKQSTRRLGGNLTGKSPGGGIATHHFACVATTKFLFEPGRYIFSTMSDDGVRLFIDGNEVISRWNHHGPTLDEEALTLTGGVHELRVEYCQESGAAVLEVDWRRA